MAQSKGLNIALIVIYVLLSIPGIFVLFKHGLRHGAVLGWFFLDAFFLLRIISSGIQLNDPTSSTAALLANIGLSPLILASLSIIHEARAYLFADRNRKLELIVVVFIHQVVAVAIALVAVGASSLGNPDKASEMSKNQTLIKVGEILLLLSWLAVAIWSGFTATIAFRGGFTSIDLSGGKILIFAVAIAMPFLGIRLFASLVYFFANTKSLNPVTGSLGLKVGLVVFEELLISVLYLGAGLVTRNIGKNGSDNAQRGTKIRSLRQNTNTKAPRRNSVTYELVE
ncbi:hypothetical protein GGR57DRAFT_60972 [Xylariaceae sp. FL1272]|nr:hypothetical protein GGR57DRAFT_60972 [Xylariaceae sp. FL1272]